MLYNFEIGKKLSPVGYLNFKDVQKLEKDLENTLADNIFEVLFEDSPLMPIYQEELRRPEADIYALNDKGDLIIIELKREFADTGAALQVLRYAQDAGMWTYSELNRKYQRYVGSDVTDLKKAHQDSFGLESPLSDDVFNKKQILYVIGNGANIELIKAVDYWKSKGITIDFIPYRLYNIGEQLFFEFFSKPYDIHENEYQTKAVLFDTNRSYNENSIWDMLSNKRVSAYGNVAYCADYLHKGDIVLYYHPGFGVVAAAKVVSKTKTINTEDSVEKYHDVEFLTPVPQVLDDLRSVPFSKIKELTGKSFYLSRTIKVPYLTIEEGNAVIAELKRIYG